MSIAELRTRLAQIGEDVSDLCEEARVRRAELERVAPPPRLEDVLAGERAALSARIARETDFTDTERRHLTELRKRRRSWNPIARSVASLRPRDVTAENIGFIVPKIAAPTGRAGKQRKKRPTKSGWPVSGSAFGKKGFGRTGAAMVP